MKALITATAGALVVYLLVGFVAWDWNAANWAPITRFYTALIGGLVAGMLATANWE